MEKEEFQTKLAAQLPENIPIYKVEDIDVKSPSATRLLSKAEYLITVAANNTVAIEQWQTWIDAVNNSTAISWEKTTKSGKKQTVNLRDRLYDLTFEQKHGREDNSVVLRYVGSCRNDGTLLTADNVIYMLEQVSGEELELLKVHRQQMILEQI